VKIGKSKFAWDLHLQSCVAKAGENTGQMNLYCNLHLASTKEKLDYNN